MKKVKILGWALVAAVTFSLTSCKKDGENLAEIETTFEASETQAVADNVDQDVIDVTEEAGARNSVLGATPPGGSFTTNDLLGNCVVVTVTGNFPAKNIKIDFGTGCTNRQGVTRKGVINVLLTDMMQNSGSVATITFDNYFVNDIKKEGTITHTNTTVAGSGTRSWTRVVTNGKVTLPTGKFWQHSANISVTQTAGVNTPLTFLDDVFTISGTRSVTNQNGKTRTSTTQTALQKKAICRYFDSGVLKVEGPNHTAIINFGDGNCDNSATISIDGRPARTIVLR